MKIWGFPGSSAGKESACNPGDLSLIPGSGRSPGEGIDYPLQYSWASLVAQLVKNPPAMWGDLGLIPGLGRSPGEGKGYPLQYSGLENSITSWEIDGETVADFIFLDSRITADGDCSHEIKRRLLLGRKVMTDLDSILKRRDITLTTKVRLVKPMVFPVKPMVFPVVMYGCES